MELQTGDSTQSGAGLAVSTPAAVEVITASIFRLAGDFDQSDFEFLNFFPVLGRNVVQ